MMHREHQGDNIIETVMEILLYLHQYRDNVIYYTKTGDSIEGAH